MKQLVIYILFNVLVYLAGSFLAWSFNPIEWWAISDGLGRVLFLLVQIWAVIMILISTTDIDLR